MLPQLILAAIPVIAWLVYSWLKNKRFNQLSHIPRVPPSLLWGHLKTLGEIFQEEPLRHYDYAFNEMLKRTPGHGGLTCIDLRPFGVPTIVIQSHELAEQVSRSTPLFKYSVPKSPTTDVMIPIVGAKSLALVNDKPWKNLRTQFNTAFAPSNLATFDSQIIGKIKIFMSVLDRFVKSGEEFLLSTPCTMLTFDVIGLSILNIDFKSQESVSERNDVVTYFLDLLATVPPTLAGDKWYLHPINHYRRINITRKLEAALRSIIQDKFDSREQKVNNIRSFDRCALAHSLRAVDSLTPEIMQQSIDSVKTFLFAGHDTTSVLLQWIFYELSRTPRALAALRSELNEVFGPDPDFTVVANLLLEGGDKLHKLKYLSAIVKETLRLHPPAGTARMVPPGTDFCLQTKYGSLPVDGLVLYICHYALQRDPDVYGETAEMWIPERWLAHGHHTNDASKDQDDGVTAVNVPVSAWRPFERGPRNCIGQELAYLEVKLVVAMVARRYDFTKVGLGASLLHTGKPVENLHGQYEVVKPLFDTFNMSAKPVDGMRMTVRLH